MHMSVEGCLLWKALFANLTNEWPVDIDYISYNPNILRDILLEFQMGRLDMPPDELLFGSVAAWGVDTVFHFGPNAFPFGSAVLCSERFCMSFPRFASRGSCVHDSRLNLVPGILWWRRPSFIISSG